MAADSAGDPQNGERVYLAHGCYGCHGYDGIGRRTLANDASPFLANESVFATYLRLRANVNSESPSNTMPNYSADVLPDDDAADLYAYIETLEDLSPAFEDIPVFKRILEKAEARSLSE